MKLAAVESEFVEFIPADLTQGKLYVSMLYATTVHLCACGCGNKVVLPLSPAEWQLYFDGESVSLAPSVGNWEYPCRSHYWIRANKIRWAAPWTNAQIAAGRRNGLALGDLPGIEQVELDFPDDAGDAGLAWFPGGEVAGFP